MCWTLESSSSGSNPDQGHCVEFLSESCAKHLPFTVTLFHSLKLYHRGGILGFAVLLYLTIFCAVPVFIQFNPLTVPGGFCQKHTFWTFWRLTAWKWAKLAPIYSKRHFQHDSMAFFPLGPRFKTFLLRYAEKSEFQDSFG